MQEALTRTVNRVDPELPVFGVRTMNELMSASMARRRFALSLMAVFAGLALFLAALGIYGVMALVVGQRAQEFGVRMALGARQRDILVLAFRPGLVLTSIGAVAGVAVSIGAMRLMSSLLFGVSPSDPFTFAAVPILLAAVALTACWLPAWRATRIPPGVALRS
jgi:ABC-type antimicrobial peptide transport system permease subunit